MRLFTLLLSTFLLLSGFASAQSLYDVIVSLSDRQRVLVQREQVRTQLQNEYANGSVSIPEDSPINWVSVGSNPSESSVNAQSLAVRIALINQAVAEFDRIAPSYVNANISELASSGKLPTLEFFRQGDFPPLPRASLDNHHEIIFQLSQRLKSLRIVLWPVAFEQTELNGSANAEEYIEYGENSSRTKTTLNNGFTPLNWAPTSIGPGTISCSSNILPYLISTRSDTSMYLNSDYYEYPSYDEDLPGPLRQQNSQFTLKYPKRAFIKSVAQDAEGLQIAGTVSILSRSSWHKLSVSNAPACFNRENAAFLSMGSSESGSIDIISTLPQIQITGKWVTISSGGSGNDSWVTKKFVESGYEFKDYAQPSNYGKSYESSWKVGGSFFGVFQPNFNRGVDNPSSRAILDKVSLFRANNSSDGKLLLNPNPSLLFGIELGPGLNGSGSGLITAGAMSNYGENLEREFTTELTYGVLWELSPVTRFDSTYALRFAGSAFDYHLVYENNRMTRTQQLPPLGWPYADPEMPNITEYDTTTLYHEWDRPRLQQIAGRDFIANISYNAIHHGGYTITLYRRPVEASAPTPGEAIDTDALTVVRVWTFSKPLIGTNPHPTDQEKLEILGSNNEKYEIFSVHHLRSNGAGWGGWYDYSYCLGSGAWTTAWWWYSEGHHKWVLKVSQGEQEKWRKEITIDTSDDLGINDFNYSAKVSTYQDNERVGELTSETLDPFSDTSPSEWIYSTDDNTISIIGDSIPGDENNPAYRYGKLAKQLEINFNGVKPDLNATWDEHGMLSRLSEGTSLITGATDGDFWKITHKFNDQTIATEWFQFTGSNSLKRCSAPDGASVARDHESVTTQNFEMGTFSTGLPGLPHKITRSNDTGTTYSWNIAADGSGIVTIDDGLINNNSVTRGTRIVQQINKRGFPTKTETFTLLGGPLKTSSSTYSEFTTWGAPQKSTDDFTKLHSSWTLDANLNRLASITSPLGLVSTFGNYDAFERPQTSSSNGITAAHTYSALNPSTTFTGAISGSSSQTRDSLGRVTSSNITWNGVSDNAAITHNSNSTEITRNNLLGEHKQTVRKEDGSVSEASGTTMAFGGTKGNALSVVNGLLVAKTEIADAPGTFAETHTDAWGRVRKIVTPQRSGNAPAETIYTYSAPADAIQRVITTEPTGEITIEESDPYNTSGAITRSGIDIDGNGSLGAADRYTQSMTTVDSGKVVTTISVTEDSGMREVLKTEWTPTSGVTETKFNGNEESITTEPNYTDKTVKTESSKGWERNTAVNALGLATTNTLSGTGIPTTELTPTWRADGSLASITFTQGGETHTANLNPNGTLATLTVPGRGNILGGHTITINSEGQGTEALTIYGKTTETALNGTSQSISGSNVIARSQSLSSTNDGYKQTITPATGAATETHYNHALVQTKKKYADQSQQTITYEGELPKTSSLARGGNVGYTFSTDGAKDLTAITWPQVESGPLEIPAFSHNYTYNRSGQVKTITDPSGTRGHNFHNGRVASTAYTAGFLKGYEIITSRDTAGRITGTVLKRDNTTIHNTVQAPNGASDQITNLASGNITATPQRDGVGRITGYIWSDGTNTVTQTWQRGIGGRIELAESNVPGAPAFDYLIDPNTPQQSFDPQNRRLKCQTTGGTWTYTYSNGQLTQATHPTLGTFNYAFDGIGRRTDKGSANTSDLLNRTIAWTNSQQKPLTLHAHPNARVWFNGVEIQNFTGTHQALLTTQNPAGEWKPWETLAILEGEGEGAGSPPTNPLASPDAKSAQSGAVWIPPAAETLTYDAAGNRQANAQWDYGWDANNQLVKACTKNYVATENTTAAPHGYDITFVYDSQGRRVKKHVIEYQNGGVVSEKIITFVWDGWDLLYERHQMPSGLTLLERKYLWGPDIADGEAGGAGGLLLIRETKGNATTDIIPLYDGTGHVIALTDIEKNLLALYTYGPFGEKIHAIGARANTNPWRWATKYLDEETGLYYFGHRYYDPVTGQWLSREPLGESESVNLYSYCHNDPVNKVDVLGMQEIRFYDEFWFDGNTIRRGLSDNFHTKGDFRTIPRNASEAKEMEKQFFDLLSQGYKTLSTRLELGAQSQNYQGQRELARLSDATEAALANAADQLRIYRVFSDADGNLTDLMLSDAARIKALMPQVASVDTRGVGDASVFFFPQARGFAAGDAVFGIVESEIGESGTYAASAGLILAQMRGARNIPLKALAKSFENKGGSYAANSVVRERVLANIAANRAATGNIRQGLTTMDLRALTTNAASEVDDLGWSAFTRGQQRALVNHPYLERAFRGNRIDKRVRLMVEKDPFLRHLQGRSNWGADFIDMRDPANIKWWDITTSAQWSTHVKKYGPGGTLLPTR